MTTGQTSNNLRLTMLLESYKIVNSNLIDLTEKVNNISTGGESNSSYTTVEFNSDFDTRLGGKTTDDISQGDENLYYTDARARGAISVSGDLNYDNTTGLISFTIPQFNQSLDDLSDVVIGTLGTDHVLYHNGTNWVNASLDTSKVSENANYLYYTDTRARSAISVSGDLSYDSSTGVISFTVPTFNQSLDDLSDVVIGTLGTDHVLYHNGTNWVNASLNSLSPTFTQLNTNTLSSTSGNSLIIQTDTLQTIEFRTAQIFPQTNNYTLFGGANNRWNRGHFVNLTVDEIDGGVANVSIVYNESTPNARLRFNGGHSSIYMTMRNDEFNCWNGSSSNDLYLNYNGGGVYYGYPGTALSDDRIKFNETNITNGLEVIRQLSPEKYTKRFPDQSVGIEEAGFIAQEVLNVPELAFAVKHPEKEYTPGDPNTRYYFVNYESIFTYAVAGLKELDTIVQQQAQLISSLEARLSALESN